MLYIYFLTFSFILHTFFINLNTNFFISCFIYVILSFIIKDIYAALSEFSIYINSNFKYDVCECCVHDVINLSNNYKYTVN